MSSNVVLTAPPAPPPTPPNKTPPLPLQKTPENPAVLKLNEPSARNKI